MVPAKSSDLPLLPVLCGPTAVGKTALALELAGEFDLEVVSADSRQVYRLMDIGTAKPARTELAQVRHHLIDVVWPDEDFHAALYITSAEAAIADIVSRGRRPILVGGTGLYIKGLTEGLLDAPGADRTVRKRLHAEAEEGGSVTLHRRLAQVDPVTAARLHPNDLVRIVRALEVFEIAGRPLSDLQREHRFRDRRYRLLKIGLTTDREQLFERINRRAVRMFESGLVAETERLLAAGYNASLKTMQTIGYRQACALLDGRIDYDAALASVQTATRRYAKQQLTWFKQDKSIIWVDSSDGSAKIRELIDNFYGS